MSTQLALLFALTRIADDLSDAKPHLTSGNLYYSTGRLAEAQAEYRNAVRILDRNPSVELVAALNNLGSTLVALHEYDRALPVLSRAAQLAPNFLTQDQVVQIQSNTVQVMIRLGMHALARPLLDQALSRADAHQTPELPYLLLSRAAICIEEADYYCADRDTDHVISSVEPVSLLLAMAHAIRASAWQKRRAHSRATEEFARAIEIASRIPGWRNSAEATDIFESYSVSLHKIGRHRQARELLQELRQRKRMDPKP